MADKKKKPEGELKGELAEPTDLEQIEAEMSQIHPTLHDLKRNDPARYKEVYRRYMWLVGERDRIKAENL